MPLGLDYEDLAYGQHGAEKMLQAQDNAIMREAQRQELLQKYGAQDFQNVWAKELAPSQFAAARAENIQKIQPIDFERLSQLVGKGGVSAMAEAIVASRNLNNRTAGQMDISQFEQPVVPPAPINPGEVGAGAKEGMDASKGIGSKGTSKSAPEQALTPEEEDIFNKLLKSAGGEKRTPNSVDSGQTPEEAAQVAAAIRESERKVYSQGRSPYAMDNASLMKMANEVDPKAYIGTQELGLAEKMLSADAQAQALALKSMQGVAQTKSLMEQKFEERKAELALKALDAKNETERKYWQGQLDNTIKLMTSLVGFNTPKPKSSSTKDPEADERKRVEAEIAKYKSMLSKYNSFANKESFKNIIVPLLKSPKFESNKQMVWDTFQTSPFPAAPTFKDMGIDRAGNKSIVPPKKGASNAEPSGTSDLASSAPAGAGVKIAEAVWKLDKSLQKYKVVPAKMFDEAANKLISQGVPPSEIDFLRNKHGDKIR